MADGPRPLVAGNWKMNGLASASTQFAAICGGAALSEHASAVICPPATLIASFVAMSRRTPVSVGGQDCHADASGAHTGDISAEMLADAGATHVITGHSERRADHGEDDRAVRAKAEGALRAGLVAIICVGETEAERDAGKALAVVTAQLAGSVPDGATPETVVVAYEPVWAIGTGRTPSLKDIAEVHDALRAALVARFGAGAAMFRLLYGGSVKPSNAAEILAVENVNGALVGGASLKADDFLAILAAAT